MKRLTTNEFVQRSNLIHNGRYSYTDTIYVRNRDKVIITCPIHGNFNQIPLDHLHSAGCPQCGNLVNKYSTEDFISLSNIKHDNYYDYSLVNYIDVRKKVLIICPLHGKFRQTAENHLRGKRCIKCSNSISRSETAWLDYLGIPDDPEHRQVRLYIDDIYYKVDGFNKETKTIYEFLGDYWHGNPKIFESNNINNHNKKSFGKLLSDTELKHATLRNAGYDLVTIWENDWKEICTSLINIKITEGV